MCMRSLQQFCISPSTCSSKKKSTDSQRKPPSPASSSRKTFSHSGFSSFSPIDIYVHVCVDTVHTYSLSRHSILFLLLLLCFFLPCPWWMDRKWIGNTRVQDNIKARTA